jgi:hypothetical protein
MREWRPLEAAARRHAPGTAVRLLHRLIDFPVQTDSYSSFPRIVAQA